MTETPRNGSRALLALFAAALLLGAALSFWMQPLAAKLLLPVLGGSPAVWNTSLVFFQATLLAGYAFAHAANRLLDLRGQALLHLALVALAAITLPIALRAAPPDPEADPVPWVIATLAVMAGAPFFVLTAASPLLQNWFARTDHEAAKDPYFLYVASNIGSMLGLLAYPLALEPLFTLRQQGWLWTAGYVLFGAAVAGCALAALRHRTGAPAAVVAHAPATLAWRLHCIALAFIPSALLVGVTGYITTDIAAAPLLWIVPLALYLLTFVIAFQRRPVIPLAAAMPLQAVLLIPLALVMLFTRRDAPLVVLLLHLAAFFATALVCHGVLVRLRPPAARLTEFYFLVSLGGVLGGAFVALLAPVVFDDVFEYPLCLVLAALLRPGAWPRRDDARAALFDIAWPAVVAIGCALLLLRGEAPSTLTATSVLLLAIFSALALFALRTRPVRFGLALGAVLAAAALAPSREDVLVQERNFFGVVRVVESGEPPLRRLYHGTTTHGAQDFGGTDPLEPLTYYHRAGPVGQFFEAFGGTRATRRVGLVGLGTGTLACYARADEVWTFYEIDPAIVGIARNPDYFTYLRDCPGWVVLGDARLTLARAADGALGLIVLDAFSSDAIPIHLITEQALRLYLDKLDADGLLLVHISNRYVDLGPVLGNLAAAIGLAGRMRHDVTDIDNDRYGSHWVALARRAELLAPLHDWVELPRRPALGIWRDDHADLIRALLAR
jgi:hypothetical protein